MSRRAEELLRELNYAIQQTDEGAPCEGRDLLFFPEGHESIQKAATLEAKLICRGCQFRVMCGAYAIEAQEQYGIFGGTTPEERRAIRKG